MKKLIFPLILVLLVCAGLFYVNKNKSSALSNYEDGALSLSYPNNLKFSKADKVVVLHHDIAFKNHGDCDMVGDEKTYERLTDFELKIQTVDKSLVETIKTFSSYIPKENFVDNKVVESPGFIDKYKVGNLDGFAIYEGAEGCGQVTYYFPVTDNKTLVANRAVVQALNPSVRSKEDIEKILATPEVVTLDKAEEIFKQIMESLRVQ